MTRCRKALFVLACGPMLLLAATASAQQPSSGTPSIEGKVTSS